MIVLGISHPISMNNAACILVNGKLVAFSEEERFTRQKHAPFVFPRKAVEFCFKSAGIDAAQVDCTAIGFAEPDRRQIRDLDLEGLSRGLLRDEKLFEARTLLQHVFTDSLITAYGEKKYFDHHFCHVASAFIPSGFQSANFISLDGWGGEKCGVIGSWRKGAEPEFLVNISKENSWGMLYELITYYIGFRPHSGEGKTMGLAAFGKVDESLLPDWRDEELGLPDLNKYRPFLEKNLKVRDPGNDLEDSHKNLAATLQYYLEDSLIKIGKYLRKHSDTANFVMAGGVALNCAANGKLGEQDFVENLFIQPASHDAGTALGAAIIAHRELAGVWPDFKFTNAYWGSSYSDEEIKKALSFSRLPYSQCDPSIKGAELLSENKVIGFFQGRAEVGPRALGARSILANPLIEANLKHINLNIKKREVWRPLAPAVCEESYDQYFRNKTKSAFMLVASQVRDDVKDRIPSVVHADGSARPQVVNKDENPIYYNLIHNFGKMSGVPVVLNTSFNLDDEPVVNSPENAIATYARSGLDALVIGNYCLEKEPKI